MSGSADLRKLFWLARVDRAFRQRHRTRSPYASRDSFQSRLRRNCCAGKNMARPKRRCPRAARGPRSPPGRRRRRHRSARGCRRARWRRWYRRHRPGGRAARPTPRARRRKSAAQIPPALVRGQAGLTRGRPSAFEQPGGEAEIEPGMPSAHLRNHRLRQKRRVVETPLPQLGGVQGHRDDQHRRGRRSSRKVRCLKVGQAPGPATAPDGARSAACRRT